MALTDARRRSPPRRVVSLVPSLTADVAALGAADRLVGCTDWCTRGAPADAVRLGGTVTPDAAAVLALRPDLVLVNREENRQPIADALRTAGIRLLVTRPRTVEGAAAAVSELADVLAVDDHGIPVRIRATAAATRAAVDRRARVLVPVWRRPWVLASTDTYLADLLAVAGLDVVTPPAVAGTDAGRWPRPGDGPVGEVEAVVLPDEPYAFGAGDHEAVEGLVTRGRSTARRPVLLHADGAALTWHGTTTLAGLQEARRLAAQYWCSGPG